MPWDLCVPILWGAWVYSCVYMYVVVGDQTGMVCASF